MAGQHGPAGATSDDGTPPEVDMATHHATFDAFINLTKWAIVFVVLLLTGMAVFLL